jgi:hypothetical protein
MPVITRRDILAASIAVAAGMRGAVKALARDETILAAPSKRSGDDRDWSKIHGFNYQPSYGTSGLELWQKFDAKIIDSELALGTKYFPHMNALRWWQSWDAFLRDPKGYARNFETTLELAEKYGCPVIPVLFNRWHNATFDYGGIYIDHFLPGSLIYQPSVLDPYLAALVGAHKDDPRVLAWDLCNEPYFYTTAIGQPRKDVSDAIVNAETAWLDLIHGKCKTLGAKAPLTIATHGKMPLERMDRFSDILSVHPYQIPGDPELFGTHADFEARLDGFVAFARTVGKPVLASECCWGSRDDQARVAIIRSDLTQFKKRGFGWTVYVLHHSMVADAHRPELGPGANYGSFAFIEADGSLRPGHEVFNEF